MPLTTEAEELSASLNQGDQVVIMAMEWVAVTREMGMQQIDLELCVMPINGPLLHAKIIEAAAAWLYQEIAARPSPIF